MGFDGNWRVFFSLEGGHHCCGARAGIRSYIALALFREEKLFLIVSCSRLRTCSF